MSTYLRAMLVPAPRLTRPSLGQESSRHDLSVLRTYSSLFGVRRLRPLLPRASGGVTKWQPRRERFAHVSRCLSVSPAAAPSGSRRSAPAPRCCSDHAAGRPCRTQKAAVVVDTDEELSWRRYACASPSRRIGTSSSTLWQQLFVAGRSQGRPISSGGEGVSSGSYPPSSITSFSLYPGQRVSGDDSVVRPARKQPPGSDAAPITLAVRPSNRFTRRSPGDRAGTVARELAFAATGRSSPALSPFAPRLGQAAASRSGRHAGCP